MGADCAVRRLHMPMEIFHLIADTSVLKFGTGGFDKLLRRVRQGVVKL